MRLFQHIFGTVLLSGDQWLICLVPGVIIFVIGEVFKYTLRSMERKG
ncbi:MAG: hypothetical protein GXY48_05340 [Methanomicrobiales archaeon]|nr:hypothetical protein [Methanomicrobiales archaeon]